MSKTFKIIIYDPVKQEKARVRLTLNMPIADIAAEIKRHFSSRESSASASADAPAAVPSG